jgi:hypothetical protein
MLAARLRCVLGSDISDIASNLLSHHAVAMDWACSMPVRGKQTRDKILWGHLSLGKEFFGKPKPHHVDTAALRIRLSCVCPHGSYTSQLPQRVQWKFYLLHSHMNIISWLCSYGISVCPSSNQPPRTAVIATALITLLVHCDSSGGRSRCSSVR